MNHSELRDRLKPHHKSWNKIEALDKDQETGLLFIIGSYPTETLCRITYCVSGVSGTIERDVTDGGRAPGPPLTPVEGAVMRVD
jgi:hypothetical protein